MKVEKWFLLCSLSVCYDIRTRDFMLSSSHMFVRITKEQYHALKKELGSSRKRFLKVKGKLEIKSESH